MSTKVEEYRGRLEHAHRYWEQNGLTGKPNADGLDASRFIEWYRGNQWSKWGWGGFPLDALITVNVTFSNTNVMMSKLSKRNPEVIVTPKRKGSNESARARRNKLILNYFQKELKFKREVDRALFDALLTPFGVIEHIYTPHLEKFTSDGVEIETYSMARPDLPGIRRRPFWDVRFDPLADSWHPDGSCRWVAFRDLMSIQQLKDHPRYTVPRDLKPTKSVDLLDQKRRANQGQDLGKEWYELVEVWRMYDKTEQKLVVFASGHDKPLLAPTDWPLPWEKLPYDILMFNPQVDSNVPLAFPQAYASQQQELNKTRTLMAELVKRLRRLVFVQRDSFTEADLKKIESGDLSLQEVFAVDGDLASVLREVGIGGFDQTLLLYDSTIKTDIREQMGLSQMDRAQRINVESAAEANAVQTGSDIQSSRPEEVFEDFWADVLRTFHQGLRFTLPEEIVVPIVGMLDAAALRSEGEFVTVTKADVHGEFAIDIRAGSTLPKDNDREFVKALQLQERFVDNPTVEQVELTRICFEESGFDSSRLVMPPETVAKTQGILDQQGLGGAEGGPKKNGKAELDANFVRQVSA